MRTLFNPFKGMYYGTWKENPKQKLVSAFRKSVWKRFFQNVKYEIIDVPKYRRKQKK